jgi:hypothetical protein
MMHAMDSVECVCGDHCHVLQHRVPDEGPGDRENESPQDHNTRSPPQAPPKHDTTAKHKNTAIGTEPQEEATQSHKNTNTQTTEAVC